MICRRATYFTDSEVIEYYKKKCMAEIASSQKFKSTEEITTDMLC